MRRFKVTQLYNSQNERVYAPKDQHKADVSDERMLCRQSGFPRQVMVSVVISKAGKSSIFFVDPGTKDNADYYRNVLLKQMIPEMDSLAKRKQYFFMQDGTRAHTAKLSLELLRDESTSIYSNPNTGHQTAPTLIRSTIVYGVCLSEMFTGGKRLLIWIC